MEKLLNLIFIPKCIFCKSEGSYFCEKCVQSSKKTLHLCNTSYYCKNFLSLYEYDGRIRNCIRFAKYKNTRFAALIDLVKNSIPLLEPSFARYLKGVDLVVPVPVAQAKLRNRGFNQAELIAKIIAGCMGSPISTKALSRIKETGAQFSSNRKERFDNLKNAFLAEAEVKEKVILLVDDVCTTGATFAECSRVLYDAGARRVICFSLAKKSLD